MSTPVLIGRQLRVHVNARTLLDNAHLQVEPGKVLGLVGPNGAGKSTLLRALLGLQPLQGGQVTLQGDDVAYLSAQQRATRMAYVAQNQTIHWPLPVQDVVALGRLPHGDGHTPAGQAIIAQAMRDLSIAQFANRNVQTLSGGERARVLMARALATQAPVLLADEPLAALDPAQQLQMMILLQKMAQQGWAVVVVLHDLTLASRFCTDVCVLQQGRIVAQGEPRSVFSDALLQQVFNVQVLRLPEGGLLPWQLGV